VWYQSRGVPVLEEDGSIREWVGCLVYIEDRKRAAQQQAEAETALRDLNERLEQRVEAEARERAQIWNVSQDLLLVADMEGKFLNVNPAWTASLGWSEADLIGNTSEWLRHPNDREKTRAELTRLAEGRRTLQFENRLRHRDGTYRWLSWTAVPDRGLIYSVARDVTELRKSEQLYHQAQAELAHVTRVTMLGELTASIAHEVSQPLAAVVSNAEASLLWLDPGTLNLDKARRSVEWIVKDGKRAGEVIHRVRALTKRADIQKAPLLINDVVDEVISLVQREMLNHRVSLQKELASDLPAVFVDRIQLQQVIINLVINSIEAMHSVTGRARELTIRSRRHGAHEVLLTVEDCGVGIPAENTDHLFIAFFTTKPSGMGMGLSIARSIIEAHGGKLWAESNLPQGAAFHFTLPLRQEDDLS